MKTFILCLLLLVSLGNVIAGPARPIYVLRILTKQCNSDGSMNIYYGYLGYGYVYENWTSGSKTCSTVKTLKSGNIVTGWIKVCRVSGKTGTFTVKYNGGTLCNKNYDSATYSNCRKTSHMCGLSLGK